jgi:hypothetical protein
VILRVAEKEGFLWEVMLDNTGRIYFPLFARAILDLFDEGGLKNISKDVSGLIEDGNPGSGTRTRERIYLATSTRGVRDQAWQLSLLAIHDPSNHCPIRAGVWIPLD